MFVQDKSIFDIQTLKRASTPVARFGSVRVLNGRVRFVNDMACVYGSF